jgi:hypothetical protein
VLPRIKVVPPAKLNPPPPPSPQPKPLDPDQLRRKWLEEVKASKTARTNVHVDQLDYGVETMRGVHFRSLRDGTGGTITTVGSDNLVRYQGDDGKDDIVGRRETEEWVVDGRRNVKLNQKTRQYQVTGPIPTPPQGVTGFPLPTAHTEEETPAKGADTASDKRRRSRHLQNQQGQGSRGEGSTDHRQRCALSATAIRRCASPWPTLGRPKACLRKGRRGHHGSLAQAGRPATGARAAEERRERRCGESGADAAGDSRE